jgi:hypothetical protein
VFTSIRLEIERNKYKSWSIKGVFLPENVGESKNDEGKQCDDNQEKQISNIASATACIPFRQFHGYNIFVDTQQRHP